MKRLLVVVSLCAVAAIAACNVDQVVRTELEVHLPRFSVTPLTGAIGTNLYNVSDASCTLVNYNRFPTKLEVGLSGLPRGAALPNGSYWVKVTDPSGGVLLGASTSANYVVGGDVMPCAQLFSLVKKASDNTVGYDDTPNGGGEYKVWVSRNSGFPTSESKTDNFKVLQGCEDDCPVNVRGILSVVKYYDANANGLQDLGETPLLEGWRIEVDHSLQYTNFSAWFETGSEVVVTEHMPTQPNWIPTTATTFTETIVGGGNAIAFGNVCIGAGGGHTLGFWSNKNGQARMADGNSYVSELVLLNALHLANASGNQPDFSTTGGNPIGANGYTAFRTWILGATATNMAYMLSAQLAAMTLNVESGDVSGGSLIYVNATLGFMTVNAVMAAAQASLADVGGQNTVASGPTRTYQETLKNALDRGNNNQNFVQPVACTYTFAELN